MILPLIGLFICLIGLTLSTNLLGSPDFKPIYGAPVWEYYLVWVGFYTLISSGIISVVLICKELFVLFF